MDRFGSSKFRKSKVLWPSGKTGFLPARKQCVVDMKVCRGKPYCKNQVGTGSYRYEVDGHAVQFCFSYRYGLDNLICFQQLLARSVVPLQTQPFPLDLPSSV